MADGSDDPEQIDDLCKLVDRGVVIAAASAVHERRPADRRPGAQERCSRGWRGCRSTGSAASAPATPPTRSRPTPPSFVREVGIDSDTGFEIGIELVAKARRLRRPVAEIPTIWLERAQGTSNFKVAGVAAPLPRLVPVRVRAQAHARPAARAQRREREPTMSSRTGARHRIGRVHRRLRRGGAAAARLRGGRRRQPLEVRPGARSRTTTTPATRLVEGDARDVDAAHASSLGDCDHFIAGAAMIGGISYFHAFAYDLLATNERIIAVVVRRRHRRAPRGGSLEKVTYISSSMVFESADSWPSYEGQELEIPPPLSSYGFQKLAVEYFARALRTSSTGCRTRSCGRSTASASARCAPSATSRS